MTALTTSVRPESTNYTANTGMGLANSANTALDGSGTVGTNIFNILTAGASGSGWKGCCINSINIKATTAVTAGMVRVFIQNTGTGASNTFLLTEVFIPYVSPSGTFKSLNRLIVFPNKLQIQAGYKILITTQNSESFAGVTDAMDWKYPA